jgi:hypothetical protein
LCIYFSSMIYRKRAKLKAEDCHSLQFAINLFSHSHNHVHCWCPLRFEKVHQLRIYKDLRECLGETTRFVRTTSMISKMIDQLMYFPARITSPFWCCGHGQTHAKLGWGLRPTQFLNFCTIKFKI